MVWITCTLNVFSDICIGCSRFWLSWRYWMEFPSSSLTWSSSLRKDWIQNRRSVLSCRVFAIQHPGITSKIDSFSLQSTRENQARIHFTEEHGTCTFIVHMYHHFHRILITIYLYTILWTLVIEPIYIDIQLYVHLLFISVIIYKLNMYCKSKFLNLIMVV